MTRSRLTFDCQDKMGVLLEGIRKKDPVVTDRWARTEEWATVEQLMEANCEYTGATNWLNLQPCGLPSL